MQHSFIPITWEKSNELILKTLLELWRLNKYFLRRIKNKNGKSRDIFY